MTVLLTSVSYLSGPKLRHFHVDPVYVIAPHRRGMNYPRFEILLYICIHTHKDKEVKKNNGEK